MAGTSDNPGQNRRTFIRQVGLMAGCGSLLPGLMAGQSTPSDSTEGGLTVSTNFTSGGGNAELISKKPATIRFTPHNEGERGWGQMWWYFLVEGLEPGEKVILQMDLGSPRLPGINRNMLFSYDQEVWGRSDSGQLTTLDGKEYFIYQHLVKSKKAWFAYELPYTPDLVENVLLPLSKNAPRVEPFILCKTRGGRDVHGLKLLPLAPDQKPTYQVWLQARSHAFETGTSWVLHELLLWLCSSAPEALKLRQQTEVTVLPIIDVDAVTEGRTGKNQKPYDHNRGWDRELSHWPEVNRIKSLLSNKSGDRQLDLFIDLHGPGNDICPYFIVPLEKDLPTEKHRANRSSFFEILGVRKMSGITSSPQSMTMFHASERPLSKLPSDRSTSWVMENTNEAVVCLTLEVNMNTPLSTRRGYADEALALGRAMSEYFTHHHHVR